MWWQLMMFGGLLVALGKWSLFSIKFLTHPHRPKPGTPQRTWNHAWFGPQGLTEQAPLCENAGLFFKLQDLCLVWWMGHCGDKDWCKEGFWCSATLPARGSRTTPKTKTKVPFFRDFCDPGTQISLPLPFPLVVQVSAEISLMHLLKFN